MNVCGNNDGMEWNGIGRSSVLMYRFWGVVRLFTVSLLCLPFQWRLSILSMSFSGNGWQLEEKRLERRLFF